MYKRYLGDRAFYQRVAVIVIPIIIQNAITNFVSLLDNIMVGQVGTMPMSGVSIVNQLMLVFNLCVFGATSGAGIFTAQFFGSQDNEGIRYTFRFKFLVCSALAAAGIGLFLRFDRTLIGLYLTGEGDAADASAVMEYGVVYLRIMLLGLLPFSIANAYSATLKEIGETFVPMVASVTAVFVNLILNYVLIFGKLGAPAMGVAGAAHATVVSRYVELAIVVLWTHRNPQKNPFIVGAYRSMAIPGDLCKRITIKGMPLLLNEFLWSSGMAFLSQCYSTCGLDVVPASNISTTLFNLTSVAFMSMGLADGIIMGQMLGAGMKYDEIQEASRKLIFLSVLSGLVFSLIMAAVSGVFPMIYNTSESVRTLAAQLILLTALFMTFDAYVNAAYFILRSGGQTYITFLFDSGFIWAVCATLAYSLTRFAHLSILPLYAICQGTYVLKAIIGSMFLKKGNWIQNLT